MATVEYDDIQLKLGSRFDKKGVTNAINNLTALKELFPMSGIKETANDMKEFANAINSIKSDTIKALANLKGNLSKATKQLLDKDKLINIPAKITVAETPKDNTIKLPFEDAKPQIQVLDLAKQRAEEERQALAQANSELQAQEEHYKTIAELAHEAVQRSEVPIASSLTDDIVNNEATADIDDSYTSSASSWQQTADNIERAKRTLNDYKAIVADIRAEEARNAEQRANTEAITNEWNEIGQAIDADISKTFSFRNAIAVTYDKLMDALGIYKKMPPTVDEIIAKMDELEKKTGGVGGEAKKALTPLEKLVQKFKNFMQYRAMRAVWSAFVNGVKEGFKNLEDWDRATGMTGFAESMDRARASLTVLKNSLAVVTAPFLEYLINILSRVASWAMTAANAISRMIAILSGKSSYRAVKWADAVADSQASAAGSAKKATQEFKKQLMAFDEINNLTAPSDSGSGGGGGGGGASVANEMFEERSVGELGDWDKFLQKIGEAWREMSDRIRTANDATSRHLNSIKDVVKAWKDFFTDPKTNFSKWSEDFASSVETIKGNVKDFIQGFKEARENGAGYLEAIQAGLDNIGKSKVPQQLANNFADTLNATEAKFKNLDGSTAVGFAHMKENSVLVSDNMKLKLGGAFNQIQNDGEKAFDGIDSTIQTKAINPVGALSGALNNVFGRTYSLTLQTNEVVNRTVHVNEIYNQIQGKGYNYYAKYASGGFPTQGQMFIAREAGPELVGTIGGQTAVVNNSDIVASVSQGVAQAVASVLGGGQQVNVTLEGDAKNLFKVVQREGRAYSARTGQPALA